MLKTIGFIIGILLIILIILRIPKESLGLSNSGVKNNLIGSSSSAEKFLNILTSFGIFIYFAIAFQLNFK